MQLLAVLTGFPYITGQWSALMTATVPAAEVSKNFGAYQDAAVREPVIITKNGRPRTVLMAYEDFVRLSKRERRAAVEVAEMAPGLDHLDAEMGSHAAD
jgi:prevent-host-death family protein